MRFLIIEDIDSIRSVLALSLKLVFQDPHIDEAATVNVAIQKLQTTTYTAVISDYDLKRGGVGTDVFEYLKANNRKEKFVLFSSEPPRNFCGVMLAKPYRVQDIKLLKAFLERKE